MPYVSSDLCAVMQFTIGEIEIIRIRPRVLFLYLSECFEQIFPSLGIEFIEVDGLALRLVAVV
jgi:hypothetical protein